MYEDKVGHIYTVSVSWQPYRGLYCDNDQLTLHYNLLNNRMDRMELKHCNGIFTFEKRDLKKRSLATEQNCLVRNVKISDNIWNFALQLCSVSVSVNDLHYGSHLHSSGLCVCVCVCHCVGSSPQSRGKQHNTPCHKSTQAPQNYYLPFYFHI